MIPDPLASRVSTDAAAMGRRHAKYHHRHHQCQLMHRVVSWSHQLKWALRSPWTRRRWSMRGLSPTGASLPSTPSDCSGPVPGSSSWSGWGAWSGPSSRGWHHPETRPCPSRGLGMRSPKADLRRCGFTGSSAGSPRPAPLHRLPPGGGGHLTGGYPADLGTRS